MCPVAVSKEIQLVTGEGTARWTASKPTLFCRCIFVNITWSFSRSAGWGLKTERMRISGATKLKLPNVSFAGSLFQP